MKSDRNEMKLLRNEIVRLHTRTYVIDRHYSYHVECEDLPCESRITNIFIEIYDRLYS